MITEMVARWISSQNGGNGKQAPKVEPVFSEVIVVGHSANRLLAD